MVQNLAAVFSLLIGTAGLMLSYAGHRQKARLEAQESALRAEEQRRTERDRERERQRHEQERQRQDQEARARREREARIQREWEARERERDRYQASMISGYIGLSASPLDDSWVVPQIVIFNGSNQPVRDVRASFRGEVTDELRLVGTGHHFFPLPPLQIPGGRYDQLGQVTVEFTDVAGVRWRREGFGDLQRARQGADGQETWGDPELPVVERVLERPDADVPPSMRDVAGAPQAEREAPVRAEAPAPAGPPPPPPAPAERRVGWLGPVVVLVSVGLIAGGVWWLLH